MKPKPELKRELERILGLMRRGVGAEVKEVFGRSPVFDLHVSDMVAEHRAGMPPKTWNVLLGEALRLAVLIGDTLVIKAVAAAVERVHKRKPEKAASKLRREVDRQAYSSALEEAPKEWTGPGLALEGIDRHATDYAGEAPKRTKKRDLIDGTMTVVELGERLRAIDGKRLSEREVRSIAAEIGVKLRPRGRPRK